jgi:hypothetical protein
MESQELRAFLNGLLGLILDEGIVVFYASFFNFLSAAGIRAVQEGAGRGTALQEGAGPWRKGHGPAGRGRAGPEMASSGSIFKSN